MKLTPPVVQISGFPDTTYHGLRLVIHIIHTRENAFFPRSHWLDKAVAVTALASGAFMPCQASASGVEFQAFEQSLRLSGLLSLRTIYDLYYIAYNVQRLRWLSLEMQCYNFGQAALPIPGANFVNEHGFTPVASHHRSSGLLLGMCYLTIPGRCPFGRSSQPIILSESDPSRSVGPHPSFHVTATTGASSGLIRK